jgi:SAF domain
MAEIIDQVASIGQTAMPRTSLTVHPDDNVATLLDFNVEDPVTTDGLPLAESIPFGHKVALRPIPTGTPVVKYGVAIGTATQDIQTGAHVHVHNCR